MSKTLAQLIADPTLANVNDAMGEQADAASKSVVLSTGSKALLTAISTALATIDGHVDGLEGFTDGLETLIGATNTALATLNGYVGDTTTSSKVVSGYDEYETVAASATSQVLGATGATGDRLSHLLIQPATTSPGSVTLKDGSTTVWTFPGGASSVTTLIPFTVPFGLKSVSGTWNVTTTTNVSVVAAGDFT